MSVRSTAAAISPSNPDPLSRQAFVGNAHRLLALGYGRLNHRKYSASDENLLTQDFVRATREVTSQTDAPAWAVNFSIHEKQKQNDDRLEGNRRLELDIVLERTGRGEHPVFKIEAKRLGRKHPVGVYLGPEGLGAFISGEYAPDQHDGGMLGYVQSRTVDAWSSAIGRRLGTSSRKFSIAPDGTWQPNPFAGGPTYTYRSRHVRRSNRRTITIYHTLFDFNG